MVQLYIYLRSLQARVIYFRHGIILHRVPSLSNREQVDATSISCQFFPSTELLTTTIHRIKVILSVETYCLLVDLLLVEPSSTPSLPIDLRIEFPAYTLYTHLLEFSAFDGSARFRMVANGWFRLAFDGRPAARRNVSFPKRGMTDDNMLCCHTVLNTVHGL